MCLGRCDHKHGLNLVTLSDKAFNCDYSALVEYLNAGRNSCEGVKLTHVGQIKKGDILEYTRKDGEVNQLPVLDVEHRGTDDEIVIMSNYNVVAFNTKMAIDGESWARDVRIKAIPL